MELELGKAVMILWEFCLALGGLDICVWPIGQPNWTSRAVEQGAVQLAGIALRPIGIYQAAVRVSRNADRVLMYCLRVVLFGYKVY